jgi:anti-sigma-K factor RskA
MFCEGLAAENYDLYVAGSADEDVRREIEAHLDQNCIACSRGVKRSVALWTTYAASLSPVEASASLRSRLAALAAVTLKRQAAVFRGFPRPPFHGTRGFYAAVAASVTVLVALGAWYAGMQYTNLRSQQLVSELSEAQQATDNLRVQLQAETSRRQQLEETLRNSGKPNTAGELDAMRKQVLKLEAQVNQYQSAIDLERKSIADNVSLVNLLSTPGARLLSLHGQEAGANAVAYSLIVEEQKLVLVASNLPKPSPGKDYQLWVIRTSDPKIVSGGTFNPEDSDRVIVEFSSGQLVSEVSAVAVTEEPAGGSDGPTGPKVLVGSADTEPVAGKDLNSR